MPGQIGRQDAHIEIRMEEMIQTGQDEEKDESIFEDGFEPVHLPSADCLLIIYSFFAIGMHGQSSCSYTVELENDYALGCLGEDEKMSDETTPKP